MLRIILDTNIYGSLILEENFKEIPKNIKNNKDVNIFGYKIIKEELKDTSIKIKLEGRKVRTVLINLYYELIKEQYPESSNIKSLAEQYYNEFRELGGKKSFEVLKNDFEIVACATIHDLDIIFSEDEKTLKGSIALNAYKKINLKNKLKTPNFYNYQDFKDIIMS